MYEKIVLKLDTQNKSEKLNIDPSTIPTLSPVDSIAEFAKGDTSPFYKIQKIDFPVVANGMNYGKQFFESYLSHLKERPTPGSKTGHDMRYGSRAQTDFLLIGGKIENGKDETGSIYLKNYIPPKAESDNANFITECKADLVHFSIVAYTRKEIIQNADFTTTINILDCGREGLRNDAVSFGEGAMDQVTNLDDKAIYKCKLKSSDTDGDNFILMEANMPNKKEFLESLKTVSDSKVTLAEMAESMGQTHLLVTKEHEDAVKLVNALKEKGIKDPIAELGALNKQIEDNRVMVRNAALDTAFGADTEGKNYLRQYADEKIGADCKDVNAAIEDIKKSPVGLKLAQDAADYMSDQNLVGKTDSKKTIPGTPRVFVL